MAPRGGPEDLPLRNYIKTLPLVVCVYDLSKHPDAPPIKTEFVDYGNAEDRRWIGRITAFAVQNGQSVETMAKADWDKLEQ